MLVALLFGIAILMTAVIYFAFWRLLRLQFSPGYAAFTFPMAIGATALYKLSNLVAGFPGAPSTTRIRSAFSPTSSSRSPQW